MRQSNQKKKWKAAYTMSIGIFIAMMILCSTETVVAIENQKIMSSDLKLAAYQVLKTKCNVCHTRQNPSKVFSLANMNKLAPKIHKQVFVKKRMPKGRNIQLTQDEYDLLEKWLLTQNLNLKKWNFQ